MAVNAFQTIQPDETVSIREYASNCKMRVSGLTLLYLKEIGLKQRVQQCFSYPNCPSAYPVALSGRYTIETTSSGESRMIRFSFCRRYKYLLGAICLVIYSMSAHSFI